MMLKVVRSALLRANNFRKCPARNFLSQAYYCKEIWENRLNSSLLQKVNLDIFYYELDQRFRETRQISAVDVDIFANAVKDEIFIDELMDLVHKLRLSADTGNTLSSTPHAVIRTLIDHNRIKDLLLALDDRLNYGLFLDNYTGNLLLDVFWKEKNFTAGAVVASQYMLQDDFSHPVITNLSLLHCYNYLLNPGEWPKQPQAEEPKEEVRVRVKYLRNPYDDEHFDLKDPQRIVGKTLATAAKGKDDPLHVSFKVLGLALFGKEDAVRNIINELSQKNIKLIQEVINLVPEDNPFKKDLLQLPQESADVQNLLEKLVSDSVSSTSEKDIANQCSVYEKWEKERLDALQEQKKQISISERLAEIEKIKKSLKEREQRLWFFQNEEAIELTLEGYKPAKTTRPVQTTKAKKKEEVYIPPEVIKRVS